MLTEQINYLQKLRDENRKKIQVELAKMGCANLVDRMEFSALVARADLRTNEIVVY